MLIGLIKPAPCLIEMLDRMNDMNAKQAIKTASGEVVIVSVGCRSYALSHKTERGWEQGSSTSRVTASYCRREAIVRKALCLMGVEREDADNAIHAAQERGLDTTITELFSAAQARLRSALPQVKGARE